MAETASPATAGPLAGIIVVTLEHAIAAPFATRQLADLGARVIKVERPGGGDFARAYDDRVRGLASHFVWLNRSKESLTLDLKAPEAREIMAPAGRPSRRLGAKPRPRRRGASRPRSEALRSDHPRLIVCDISGYGGDGPYRDRKAYDLLIQSEAGFLSVTGTPEEPVKAGLSMADIAAGMYAFSGILAALLQRERTGRGAASRSRCWSAGRVDGSSPLLRLRRAGRRRRARAPSTPPSSHTGRSLPAMAAR